MIEDLYHIFEETKKKVKDRGVKLIDDAIAIRRIQGISADGWKTEYFSLLLSENPIICLYTDGRVYVCFGGENLLLDLNDEAVREMHSILEEW